MKKVSIVLPIYNEEKNISLLYEKLSTVIDRLPQYDFELIFINDGSKDHSWKKIITLKQQNVPIIAISFTRNFGHQIALTAGYDIATGDAIITMDADMQHPPSTIPSLLNAWKQGADIVYVKRNERNDTFLKKITAIIFYKLLDAISDINIPRHVADFRLIDKKVLTVLKESRERTRYLRGMVAWTGFNYTFVTSSFDERHAGTSGYTWKKMFKLAFDGITAFSLFPLKIAAFVGVFVILTGTLMFAYISFEALYLKAHYPLFKWLVTIIYIFMGVLFLLLWLIGEYIGRMYEQIKERPLYIVSETYYNSPKKNIHKIPNSKRSPFINL